MPRTKRYARRSGRSGKGVKRRGTFKRRYGRKRANPTRVYPGFPHHRVVKLRYVHAQSFSAGSAFNNALSIAANGCYDPDQTGGGHQPLGFDQWSQFYNHYVVLGSKITAQLTAGNNNNNSDGAIFFCYLNDDGTIPTSVSALIEQGKAHYTLVPGNLQTQRAVQVRNTYSAKKFFNVKDVKDNLTRIGAATSANPSDLAMFNIGFSAITAGSTFGGNWSIIVTIDYIVSFSEPRELAQS